MNENGQSPIPWSGSSQIKAGLALFSPLLFRFLSGFHWFKHLLIDQMGMDSDTFHAIMDWLFATLSAVGGSFWIFKRVQAGNNPASPAAPIQAPGIVTAVKRLTGDIGVPK